MIAWYSLPFYLLDHSTTVSEGWRMPFVRSLTLSRTSLRSPSWLSEHHGQQSKRLHFIIRPKMASIYDELDTHFHQIRLLELQPSQTHSGHIRCQMKTVGLSDPPPYEAVSYVWGNPSHTVPIEVNGTPFGVTKKPLGRARTYPASSLSQLTLGDTICINQQKGSERNDRISEKRYRNLDYLPCHLVTSPHLWIVTLP
jgi:hypothetical protein